jgi:hypothetical protein
VGAAGPSRTEKEFQQWLTGVAEKHGWMVNHVRPALVKGRWVTNTTLKGWPDLTLIRPPQLLFLELKRDRQAVADAPPEQQQVIAALQQCPGVLAYIVCPDDMPHLARILGTKRANLAPVNALPPPEGKP